MDAEAAYVAEELFQLWLDVNVIIGGWALAFFLFRYRPWWWVAVFKALGLLAVLVFQSVVSLALISHGLPSDDTLLYAVWALLGWWLTGKAAREGLAHGTLLLLERRGEVASIHERTAVLSRGGQEATLQVTVVEKSGRR